MAGERYTKEHEWIRMDGDVGTVGISNYAQEQLGDVVYIELPDVGRQLNMGGEAAVVESVKAASEIYAPVGGEVSAVNETLADDPAKINADALGDGWIYKLRVSDTSGLDGLMDETAYAEYVAGLD